MDLEKLRCFIAAANFKSITKAADAFYVTQPTLSKYISSLEDELGTKLMNRQNGHIKLTPQGKYLYEVGTKMLGEVDEIVRHLRQIDSGAEGDLNVSCEKLVDDRFSLMLRDFPEKFPDIEFCVKSGGFEDVFDAVEKDLADIGIVRSVLLGRDIDERLYEFRVLYKSRLRLVVSEKHPLADKKSVKMDELKGERLFAIKSEHFTTAGFLERIMNEGGFDCVEVDSRNDTDAFLQVEINRGISFIEGDGGMISPRRVRFLEIEDMDTEMNTVLFFKRGNDKPTINAFVENTLKYFPPAEG